MECLRCTGLIISEQFYDFLDGKSSDFIGYRCLVCGAIVDPVLLKNKSTKNGEQNNQIFIGQRDLHTLAACVLN